MKTITLKKDGFNQVTVEFQPDCWEYWRDEKGDLIPNINTNIEYAYNVKVYRNKKLLIEFDEGLYIFTEPYEVVKRFIQHHLTAKEALELYNHLSSTLSEKSKNYSMDWLQENQSREEMLNSHELFMNHL